MGKCKHYRVTLLRYFAGSFGQACECGQHGPPDARVCSDCHAWLPLGPSNDTPREVQIEIRAAEIAVNVDEMTEWWMIVGNTNPDENHGWRDYANEDRGGDCPCASNPAHVINNWHAGHLARAIASHPEEQS